MVERWIKESVLTSRSISEFVHDGSEPDLQAGSELRIQTAAWLAVCS